MIWIAFLILFPLIPATLLLAVKSRRIMNGITIVSAIIICLASIGMAAVMIQDHPGPEGTRYFALTSQVWNQLIIVGDIILSLAFLFVCRRLPFKRYWIPLLVILQYGAVGYYDLSGRVPVIARHFFVDNLTIIMALLIGVVGSLIAIFTTGYMRHYHEEHPEIPDRTNRFLGGDLPLLLRHVWHHLLQLNHLDIFLLGDHHILLFCNDRLFLRRKKRSTTHSGRSGCCFWEERPLL